MGWIADLCRARKALRNLVSLTNRIFTRNFLSTARPSIARLILRPPMRRQMLKDIAQKYKFNIIRIYSSWVYHNREPDRFTFDELEEVLGYCDEFGLRVLMGVITRTLPIGSKQAHPETRYVDADDHAFRLGGSGNNVSGGWPGLCLDWEPVRQAAAKFIQEMARRWGSIPRCMPTTAGTNRTLSHPGRTALCLRLEERLFCYCPRTISGFQQWLQRRYGTIDQLNEAWVRPYPDWSAIDPPRRKGTYSGLGRLAALYDRAQHE